MDALIAQKEIARWARDTFGPVAPSVTAARMNKEVAELITLLNIHAVMSPSVYVENEIGKILEECADVFIVLVQIIESLGGRLDDEVQKKMDVNRRRTWKKTASGDYQHADDPRITSEAQEPAPRSLKIPLTEDDSLRYRYSATIKHNVFGEAFNERVEAVEPDECVTDDCEENHKYNQVENFGSAPKEFRTATLESTAPWSLTELIHSGMINDDHWYVADGLGRVRGEFNNEPGAQALAKSLIGTAKGRIGIPRYLANKGAFEFFAEVNLFHGRDLIAYRKANLDDDRD